MTLHDIRVRDHRTHAIRFLSYAEVETAIRSGELAADDAIDFGYGTSEWQALGTTDIWHQIAGRHGQVPYTRASAHRSRGGQILSWLLGIVMVLVGCGVVYSMLPCTPQKAVEGFEDAMIAQDWPRAAGYVSASSLQEFAQLRNRLCDEYTQAGITTMPDQSMSVQQFRSLDDKATFAYLCNVGAKDALPFVHGPMRMMAGQRAGDHATIQLYDATSEGTLDIYLVREGLLWKVDLARMLDAWRSQYE